MKIFGVVLSMVVTGVFSAVAVHGEVIDCKVVSARKNTFVFDCGSKAATLKPGDNVKVRFTPKRREPLMGC